jgi:hypothetical protein
VYLGEAANGDQRAALAETLALLSILRRLDARAPVVQAWRSAYEGAPPVRADVAAWMLAHREPGVALEQDACRR